MYTIGQISTMTKLPISTLRYYDKEGLFPNLKRSSGIRKFSKKEIEAIRIIECLKSSGLEIKDIKQFMSWTLQGNKTFKKRKDLFERQKKIVEQELESTKAILNTIEYKCWYYEQAIENNSEDFINIIDIEQLPLSIQKEYDILHKLE